MNFKKVSLISLAVLNIFSMSGTLAFAANTKHHRGGNFRGKIQSKIRNKKSSIKKEERKVCFCKVCGGRVASTGKRCRNKTCFLSNDNEHYINNIKTCYLSEIEKEKKEFPKCKICETHDVKLMFGSHGYAIHCYGKCRRITDHVIFVASEGQNPVSVISSSTTPVFNVSKSAIKFSDEYDGFITGLDCKEDLKFFEGVRFAEFISSVSENSEDCIYYLDTTIEDKPRVVKRFLTPQDECSLD